MAIDDHPVTALRRQFEIEDVSSTPFVSVFVKVLSSVLEKLPILPPQWTLFLDGLKSYMDADSGHRIKTMLDTCADEVLRLSADVGNLSPDVKVLKSASNSPNAAEYEGQAKLAARLVLDAARKASATRDENRIKRIGTILAHGSAAYKHTRG